MEKMITGIITKLEDVIAQAQKEPLTQVGSRVANIIFMQNEDDIDIIYKEYPVLEEIAELGAELETIEDDELYRKQLFRMITIKLDSLKKQLNSV